MQFKIGDIYQVSQLRKGISKRLIQQPGFKHEKSGARLFYMEMKMITGIFNYLQDTSQGQHRLPHILEHSVLCGSEIPDEESFVELAKAL